MLSNHEDKVKLLLEWYIKSKEVSIKAESMDKSNTGYIQPLHEQRYCLDHFMRAINYYYNNESDKIIEKAINSAIGHLQRVYSDSIEWMLVSVKEEYLKELNQYSNEQILQGFPEYYSEIRPDIEEITEQVNNYKTNKSIEKTSSVDPEIKSIESYFFSSDIVTKLETYRNELHKHIKILSEIKFKDRKYIIRDKLLFPILTGIIGAVLGGLILFFIKC